MEVDCLAVAYVIDYGRTPYRLAQNSTSAGHTGRQLLRRSVECLIGIRKTDHVRNTFKKRMVLFRLTYYGRNAS
jgi:hypothetical protein